MTRGPLEDVATTAARPASCLVVDDEAGVCHFMTAALHRFGIAAAAISSATDLRDAIEDHAPQLIFLDAALDRSDAVDAIRVLGEIGYKGSVQLMSGRAAELIEELRRIGAARGLAMRPVLAKPFRLGQLAEALAGAGFAPDPGDEALVVDGAVDPAWLSFLYRPQVDPRDGALVAWSGELHLSAPHAEGASLAALTGRCGAGDVALFEGLARKAARPVASLSGADVPVFATIRMSLSRLRAIPVAAVLRDTGLRDADPCPLRLEIPGGDMLADPVLAEEIVLQLRLHGIPVVAGDVGATYVSFVGHRRLPVTQVRLAPKVVTDCGLPQNRLRTEKIIDILHRAGSSVLADGVAEKRDLDFLGVAGCDLAQGPVAGAFLEPAGQAAPENGPRRDHRVSKFYEV